MALTQSNNFMPIILFDGVCNFCNRTVNIILKYDQDAHFQFAPSQSNAGINILQKYNLDQKINQKQKHKNTQTNNKEKNA